MEREKERWRPAKALRGCCLASWSGSRGAALPGRRAGGEEIGGFAVPCERWKEGTGERELRARERYLPRAR
jgi:hypothetical protein